MKFNFGWILIVFFLILIFLFYFLNSGNENIVVEGNLIKFDSLTLKQKIAQMVMVRGDGKDYGFNDLMIGGIFLDRQESEENYEEVIKNFQKDAKISLIVATDLEGAWNPFEGYLDFPSFVEINSSEEANIVGFEHGKVLNEIGFNLNFAPVAEYSDGVYGGRTFSGSNEEIADKVGAYILGLQLNVKGVCKHYPGNSMEKNLHEVSDQQVISEKDLYLFDVCLENNISAIMIGHQIATGILDSRGEPSTVSQEVVSGVKDSVLVISDEINMAGLGDFYSEKVELYGDLINAGENLILDFDLNVDDAGNLIEEIEKRVGEGFIEMGKIDESVKKILTFKRYKIV